MSRLNYDKLLTTTRTKIMILGMPEHHPRQHKRDITACGQAEFRNQHRPTSPRSSCVSGDSRTLTSVGAGGSRAACLLRWINQVALSAQLTSRRQRVLDEICLSHEGSCSPTLGYLTRSRPRPTIYVCTSGGIRRQLKVWQRPIDVVHQQCSPIGSPPIYFFLAASGQTGGRE